MATVKKEEIKHKYKVLPAFDLIGFTKIVESGGELYTGFRNDGRWETLKDLGGADKTIYGVATEAKGCPEGHYRYTLAVKKLADTNRNDLSDEKFFTIHIKQSEWIVFTIDHFASQYGAFWNENPYELIKRLGYDFNRVLNLHIDVFPQTYNSDEDEMEFMMPVKSKVE